MSKYIVPKQRKVTHVKLDGNQVVIIEQLGYIQYQEIIGPQLGDLMHLPEKQRNNRITYDVSNQFTKQVIIQAAIGWENFEDEEGKAVPFSKQAFEQCVDGIENPKTFVEFSNPLYEAAIPDFVKLKVEAEEQETELKNSETISSTSEKK